MVFPNARAVRRVKRKTPSGRLSTHYELKKPSRSHCGGCGSILHGTSSSRRLSASQKSPSRPYGGVLCSPCTRAVMKKMVR